MNELRDLVSLFQPIDLFPCVEDRQKLAYLDLEGCFGDICDLKGCTYIKAKREYSDSEVEEALRTVLEEKWAYDDISDMEFSDEDETGSEIDSVDEISIDNTGRLSVELMEMCNAEPNAIDENEGATTDDDSENICEPLVTEMSTESQGSESVLWWDGEKADPDLISHFIGVASRGEPIGLKSVQSSLAEVSF